MFSNKNISKNRKNTFLGSHKALNDSKNESANFAIVLDLSTKISSKSDQMVQKLSRHK